MNYKSLDINSDESSDITLKDFSELKINALKPFKDLVDSETSAEINKSIEIF